MEPCAARAARACRALHGAVLAPATSSCRRGNLPTGFWPTACRCACRCSCTRCYGATPRANDDPDPAPPSSCCPAAWIPPPCWRWRAPRAFDCRTLAIGLRTAHNAGTHAAARISRALGRTGASGHACGPGRHRRVGAHGRRTCGARAGGRGHPRDVRARAQHPDAVAGAGLGRGSRLAQYLLASMPWTTPAIRTAGPSSSPPSSAGGLATRAGVEGALPASMHR